MVQTAAISKNLHPAYFKKQKSKDKQKKKRK